MKTKNNVPRSAKVGLVGSLHRNDTIVTFNYDLVPERALRGTASTRGVDFRPWLYALETRPFGADLPYLLKLHGSSNWRLPDNQFQVLTHAWADFDVAPGYQGHRGRGTVFPIFLPFWDKRIEEAPWLSLWREAFFRLKRAVNVIVWGYSLPVTDVKSYQLFALSLAERRLRLCVIDPSPTARGRWRALVPDAQYWEYNRVESFLVSPPPWWSSLAGRTI